MVNIQEIERQALQLSLKERAALAKRLLESLDEETDSDAEIAWIKEAERRSKDVDSGKAMLIPAKDMIKELRSKLDL